VPPQPPPADSGSYGDPGPQGNPNYQGDPNYQGNQYGDQGGNQGYDDQQPYYDPRPDGNYDDGSYDDQYNPQTYSDNQGPVDESVFYGELSPYGRWIQRGSYGWVWEPTQVSVGWRPYTQGHWVNTDYGWTWVSSEPWGWATYHYGRWTLDSEYGWLWVPGSDWGPAWVSFQEGGGYVGWAPLPPAVGFRAGIGIQIGGLSLSASIDPYAYSFVPERSFLDDRLEILPPARNVTFIHETRNITNITVVNNRVFNRGVEEQRIAQATGRPVRHYQIAEVRNPAQGRVAQVQGDRVSIFRPGVTLAKPRPSVTPTVVLQQRRQRALQAQRVQPGQRPGAVQPGQQAPGRMAPDHAYDQVNPNPANGRRVFTPADMPRKHQAEDQQLQARQDAERSRLQQQQQQERTARQNDRAQSAQVAAQQQAEQRAQQQQQQREQQMLQARHQREQQAAQSRPRVQAQPSQQQQQQQNRQEQRQDRREQKPPPPPPSM
jgi:hypothetical protein